MFEKNALMLLLLATATILVGTVVTMVVPFSSINDPKHALAQVKPYTALQLEGRDIYIREGCNNCHTQTVRPLLSDTERYGEYSKIGEFVYDQPFLWGSRRTGPDLARIGGKYPDAWHVKHMADPQSMVPRSNMPAYAFLNRPLDTSVTERKMKALKFPYTQDELKALQGKSEMDAMVAYLQKLGSDIAWRKAAQPALAGDLKNPFQGNPAVLGEGEALYKQHCAQCHGDQLEGGVGPELHELGQPEAKVFGTVFNGSPAAGMPAFSDSLGKERSWKVVTFLMSRQKH